MKIDKKFDIIYEQVQNICTSIGIFITMNRNIEDRDKKKYYKHTYFIPAIDRIIRDLRTRISTNEEKVSMISNLLTGKNEINFRSLAESFQGLISSERFIDSLTLQLEFEHKQEAIKGMDVHQALEKTEIINPHIHMLMQILATYPVTPSQNNFDVHQVFYERRKVE